MPPGELVLSLSVRESNRIELGQERRALKTTASNIERETDQSIELILRDGHVHSVGNTSLEIAQIFLQHLQCLALTQRARTAIVVARHAVLWQVVCAILACMADTYGPDTFSVLVAIGRKTLEMRNEI